jgi:two-component system response regulator
MSTEILLVEDNRGDARLLEEMFLGVNTFVHLHVVSDGVEALAFLRHQGEYIKVPRPDLILLDLNLPKMDGREFLAYVKKDPRLNTIPIIVLTTSQAEVDIVKSYALAVLPSKLDSQGLVF